MLKLHNLPTNPTNIYFLARVLDGGTIYTSGAITNVEGYEDYLVSPTPLYALVNLRAQNVTLPTCPV